MTQPLAATHGGRRFKSMGDGFLVEFRSAVQALGCAIVIQSAVNAQPEGVRLRIGAHQGEVVAESVDLFTSSTHSQETALVIYEQFEWKPPEVLTA